MHTTTRNNHNVYINILNKYSNKIKNFPLNIKSITQYISTGGNKNPFNHNERIKRAGTGNTSKDNSNVLNKYDKEMEILP